MYNVIMNSLFKEYMEEDSKPIGMKTGFNIFDIPTAHEEIDTRTGLILPNGGLFPRYYTVIGESGTGKTTICIQLAGSIADHYQGANMVFIDAEGNTTPDRIMKLNHWTPQQYRSKCMYIPPYPSISITDVYNVIRKLCRVKEENKRAIRYTIPYMDIYTGKNMSIYPPTVIIMDSVPSLVASGGDEVMSMKSDFKETDAISQNIDAMREAKDNMYFLKRVKSKLAKYNIIFLSINHLTKEVKMGPFDMLKKYHPNLKAGEKVFGGKEQLYQSFSLIKFTPKNPLNERNPDYGDDIRGSIVEMELIKNKSNESGNAYRIVFDKKTGFRPELTDFEYLFSNKIGLGGSPAAMYLKILPEIKFTRKTLLRKCYENPILARALDFTVKYIMTNKLITYGRYGDIQFDQFATLPLPNRTSIIMGMTMAYPGYIGGDYIAIDKGNEMHKDGIEGSFVTDISPMDYISPANVELINNTIRRNTNGFVNINKWIDQIDEL